MRSGLLPGFLWINTDGLLCIPHVVGKFIHIHICGGVCVCVCEEYVYLYGQHLFRDQTTNEFARRPLKTAR